MRFTSKKEREFSLAGGPGCTGSSLLLLYSTRWPKSCVCVPLAAVGELLYSKVPPPPHSLYLRTEVVFYLVKQDFALADGLDWVGEVLLALYWLVRCARIPHWL